MHANCGASFQVFLFIFMWQLNNNCFLTLVSLMQTTLFLVLICSLTKGSEKTNLFGAFTIQVQETEHLNVTLASLRLQLVATLEDAEKARMSLEAKHKV